VARSTGGGLGTEPRRPPLQCPRHQRARSRMNPSSHTGHTPCCQPDPSATTQAMTTTAKSTATRHPSPRRARATLVNTPEPSLCGRSATTALSSRLCRAAYVAASRPRALRAAWRLCAHVPRRSPGDPPSGQAQRLARPQTSGRRFAATAQFVGSYVCATFGNCICRTRSLPTLDFVAEGHPGSCLGSRASQLHSSQGRLNIKYRLITSSRPDPNGGDT
jgi:hypothetical protein